jgi:hypothetical protein
LAVIDTTTAIILIILLIVGAFIINRIFQRRRQLLGQTQTQTQTKGQDAHDNYGDNNNLEVDMAKSDKHSIISGFPTIQNKLKIIAALGTFIFIIIILAESVVIVQAGHRGVVLRRSRELSIGRGDALHNSLC